jgi:glycosyltransferase involved in cell wall biosynthesis
MAAKNILLLHSSSDMYGASKVFLNVITILHKSGYNLFVVVSEDGPLVEKLKELEVSFEVIKLGILRRKYYSVTGAFNRIVALYKAMRRLSKIIKEREIDLIYSNTTAVLIGAIIARRKRISHVWHVHEIIMRPVVLTKVLSFYLKKSKLVIAVSNQVKEHWEKMVGSKANMFTLYNGFDYQQYLDNSSSLRDELAIKPSSLLIGMIGRVNHWKGQRYFIEIASKLKEVNSDIHFVMAGDAFPGYEYLYKELEQLITDKQVQQCMSTLGFRKDIPNILGALDLFVLPSILPDPLPTVVLEAMASSKAVVATSHGGALEMVIEGETGIFIPPDDITVSAQKISSLIASDKLTSMGKKGRQRVLENFSYQKFEAELIERIKEV